MDDSNVFFNGFLTLMVRFFNNVVRLFKSVQIGPLNWWQWIIGGFAFTLILAFIRMLSGTSAPSLSGLSSGRSESHKVNK